MEQAQNFAVAAYEWAHAAYRLAGEEYAFVNAVLALIIAMIVTNSMREWAGFWRSVVWATALYFTAETLLPVIVNRVPPRYPAVFELNFWHHAASLFAAYVIVIAVFFAVKQTVLRPRHPVARI